MKVSPCALNVSSAAKIHWPMKIRSIDSISEMATTHDIVNDVLLEDKLVQIWPDCMTSGQYLNTNIGMCDSWQWKK